MAASGLIADQSGDIVANCIDLGGRQRKVRSIRATISAFLISLVPNKTA